MWKADTLRKVTEDAIWDAYWVLTWITLEANLGVICASAPALKVFFKHYFAMDNSRIGTFESSGHARLGHPYTRQSQPPLYRSQIEAASPSKENIPLGRIRVSHKLDVRSGPRESVSSFTGTSVLTALPVISSSPLPSKQVWEKRNDWTEDYRNIRTALTPGSKSTFGNSMGNPEEYGDEVGCAL